MARVLEWGYSREPIVKLIRHGFDNVSYFFRGPTKFKATFLPALPGVIQLPPRYRAVYLLPDKIRVQVCFLDEEGRGNMECEVVIKKLSGEKSAKTFYWHSDSRGPHKYEDHWDIPFERKMDLRVTERQVKFNQMTKRNGKWISVPVWTQTDWLDYHFEAILVPPPLIIKPHR